MTTKVYTDRSRILDYQSCPRRRFLAYHQDGLGITSVNKPLPLAVGGSVHAGLASLLDNAQAILNERNGGRWDEAANWSIVEHAAVTAALADFAAYAGHLELDTTEDSAMQPASDVGEQLAASLGMSPTDAGLPALAERVGKARSEFDLFLYEEQKALVEAMVRAYARRRLRPLLEQFEVLEVEREGQWLLSEWPTSPSTGTCPRCHIGNDTDGDGNCGVCARLTDAQVQADRRFIDYHKAQTQLWFMSRPDALLLDRSTRDLYLLSFKTAATWDVRKARDAEHDMQGLSEGVEVERRLAGYWNLIHDAERAAESDEQHPNVTYQKPGEVKLPDGREVKALTAFTNEQVGSFAMMKYLRSCAAPPRIHAIRYEYMLKGPRRRDKDLSQRLALDCNSQASHLVRAYYSAGMAAGDETWNWSWEYLKPGGESSKLYWKAWRPAPVWEHMPIRDWIDRLDAVETVDGDGQSLGWTGPAQATGGTSAHPLDAIFLPPMVIYRQDDDLRDWMEQTEAQERRVAEGVALVRAAGDEGERRHLLNLHFEQYRKSCEYPSTCQFCRICFGGEEIRRDPLGSGLYQIRTANHPAEVAK